MKDFRFLTTFAQSELSDIREIVPQPNYWLWLGIAVVVLILAALFFVWKRRKKATTPAAPVEAPDLKALRRLADLHARGDETDADAFTVEASSILRNYLEEALQLPAPEQTSEEFLQELRTQSWLTPALQQTFEDFMRLTDLVKFARQPLTSDQRSLLLESARQVIETTRPQPETASS